MRAGQRHSRDGLSLVEVLVAITILLVGVYAVAKGFPQLLRTIDNNKLRTERTRDAQAILDGWVSNAARLPIAITYDPDNDPDGDPTTPAEAVDPTTGPMGDQLNGRDDLYRVIGEKFTLPRYVAAIPPGGGPSSQACVHVLDLGPAHYEPLAAPPPSPPAPDPPVRPDVYELVPLHRADTSAGYQLAADEFDVVAFDPGPDGLPGNADDGTGLITLSNFIAANVAAKIDPGLDEVVGTPDDPGFSIDELVADYTWVDINGELHLASDVRLRIDISIGPPNARLVAIYPSTMDPATGYDPARGYDLEQILPETVRLRWKNHFAFQGDAEPAAVDWSLRGRNEFLVDNILSLVGAELCFTLVFNPREAAVDVFGRPTRERVLWADYYLATEWPPADDREERTQWRQMVIMTEDHQVPLEENGTDDTGNPIHRVKLRTRFLDMTGAAPLAIAGTTPVNIVAVDLHDGTVYSDAEELYANPIYPPQYALLYRTYSGHLGAGPDGLAGTADDDLARIGEVFFRGRPAAAPYLPAPVVDPGDPSAGIPPSPRRGHKVRFYYRGEQEPTQRLQKAAATFIAGPIDAYGADPNGVIMASIPPDGVPDFPEEAYREYTVDLEWDPGSGDPMDLSKLAFRRSCIGQAVEVDYLWEDPDATEPGLKRTNGELHIIAGDMGAPQNAVMIRLRHNPGSDPAAAPDGTPGNGFTVRAVLAVRGVSAKSLAWWRTSDGKLRHVEVSTYLTSATG